MKKILPIGIAILVITGAILALRPSKSIDKNLILADEWMSTRPDSALQVLEKLDATDFEGENRALYALLMTQARFKNYDFPKSDSLIKIAYEYYIPGKDSLRKAQSYFYQGRIDENSGNKDDAIKNFQKSARAALPIQNYDLLSLIYNRWGLLLRKQYILNDALLVQDKSFKYATLANNIRMKVFILKEIGTVYSAMQEYDKARIYYNKALYFAKKIDNKECISDLYSNLSYISKCTGKYNAGLYYVNKSIALLSDSVKLYSRFSIKGDLLIFKHQYDSARYYLKLSNKKGNMALEATYYLLMSKLEEGLGHYKIALSYSNKHIDYIFRYINEEKENAIAELQKKYDYSLIKNENDKLKIARQQMHIIILAISLVAIIATFSSLYYFYRKRYIKRTMKLELDKMQRDLVNEKSNSLKEKTIEAQRNLIKEQELGLELSQKTEALKQHKERERELKDYIFQMEAIVQKINTFNSMKPLQRSKSESQFTLSFQELNDLEEAVNLCYDHFADRLRAAFPKLKDDDIHLCCLLKMKVPNKNILSLLDTNELTLKKRRYRIKHDKMNLPDDFSSLEEFLFKY